MRGLVLLLPMVLLTGCGTFADPTTWLGKADVVEPSELVELQNVIQPETVWTADTGAGTDEQRLALEPHVLGESVYVTDGRGLIVRLYECLRKRGEVTLRTGFPLTRACRSNLLEAEGEKLEVAGNKVSFCVKPYQIVTLRLLPEV